MNFLGGQQGETLGKVEAHLVSEYALGPHARTVVLDHTVLADVPQ